MRFSYRWLKKILPNLPNRAKTAELLTMHLFESMPVGPASLEVEILPNRYSDAASHIGLAKELAAILNSQALIKEPQPIKAQIKDKVEVVIKTPFCRRMAVRYFTGIKIKPSPKWMQQFLRDAGMEPINNLVDITNYVTLETGQPLHAFDWDKAKGNQLYIRAAHPGEKVVSLDGKEFTLDKNNIVLSDKIGALDVAGIKGGKRAEISNTTTNILLTAGNFDGTNIYKTSRQIGLATDASLRFSHNISPELVDWGIRRATELILELCGGKPGPVVDINKQKTKVSIHKFDLEKFNHLSGLDLEDKEAINYLLRLGFKLKPGHKLEAPLYRTDIERFEDLVEEITRLYGYQNLPATPPQVALQPSGYEDLIVFKNKIRDILTGFGLDEVYNYSFISAEKSEADAVPLENPISSRFAYLRPSLIYGLSQNIKDNKRFFDRIAIFEIGRIFLPLPLNKKTNKKIDEKLTLGLALYEKGKSTFFELKGIIESLFEQLGLTDYLFYEDKIGKLKIESSGHLVGYIDGQFAEIDLDKLMLLVKEEKFYKPLVKYPSIIRDLSLLVPQELRFSEIMSMISQAAPKYLDDIDLIDYYEDPKRFGYGGKRSITVRLVFQSNKKTLTDAEVNKEMDKIVKALVNELDIEVR